MKFLKEMIARSGHAPDPEDAGVVAFQDIVGTHRKAGSGTQEQLGAETEPDETGEPGNDLTEAECEQTFQKPDELMDEPQPYAVEPEPIAFASEDVEDDAPTDLGTTRIWEMFEDQPDDTPTDSAPEPAAESSQNELAREAMELLRARAGDDGVAPQAENQGGRVKTRILGFTATDSDDTDVFSQKNGADLPMQALFAVGWLVVVKGPGRGTSLPIYGGASHIGRGDGQAIRLNFGDTSISRENHAAIAYDDEQNAFFIGHGGKANIVRLNGKPVLSTEELATGDQIRIGETTLRFVALCDDTFQWQDADPQGAEIV